jgi:DNA replication protein DnaC
MPGWFKRIAGAVRRTQRTAPPVEPSEASIAARIACLTAARDGKSNEQPSVPRLAVKRRPRPVPPLPRSRASKRTAPPIEGDELLSHRLQALGLPQFQLEHDRLAQRGDATGFDHRNYLLHLAASEVAARDRRRVARLIRAAGFPALPGADGGDSAGVPGLADCRYIGRGENVVMVGGDGGDRTRLAVGLGFAACNRGLSVRYTTAGALVAVLNTAFDEHRLLRLYRQLDAVSLLIIDDLGAAPLPPSDAALLFEVFSRRAERRSTLVATSLWPEEWSRIFGGARLAAAVTERLARRVHRVDLGAGDVASWLPSEADSEPVWRAEPIGRPEMLLSVQERKRAAAGKRLLLG